MREISSILVGEVSLFLRLLRETQQAISITPV